MLVQLIAVIIVGFVACAALSLVVERAARALGLFDVPEPRRIHTQPIPRLGGLAIAVAFIATAVVVVRPHEPGLGWVLAGATFIVAVMLVDDVRGLSPIPKGIAQIVAALFPVAGGIEINDISNPLNNPLDPNILLPPVHVPSAVAAVLTVAWLFAMMNVINWMDGIDGLAAGIVAIAASVLAAVTLARMPGQGDISLLLVALAACAAGFLPRNWSPSSIIMGDTGAHFLGYMLGVLAILGGARLANAALVLGIPIFDAAWVIASRLHNRRNPMFFDLGHLHHRLLKAGLSQPAIVLLLYALSAAFGLAALLLPKTQKLFGFALLIVVASALTLWLTHHEAKNREGSVG